MSLLKDIVDNSSNIKPEYIPARDSFWEYCKLKYPKHFKESRKYQKRICNAFQALYEERLIKFSKDEPWQIVDSTEGLKGFITCKKMMLNVPPRHYKSFTATLFSQWVLGKNNENTIITCSYNETLSTRFGKAVRDGIDETKLDSKRVIFNDVFPTTHIKYGDSAASLWSLEGHFFNYLATSFNGTVTGIGCKIGIIDDQIKTSEEAYNEALLQKHWEWYNDTWLSRLEEGAIQIVIMTRWSTKDICGRLLEIEGDEWFEMRLKAVENFETGEMLCPEILSWESYKDKTKPGKMSPEIALANYQQEPVDSKGRLYSYFKTYKNLPSDGNGKLLYDEIIFYGDTADQGIDWLCGLAALKYNGEGFVIEVYFTNEGMEITEPGTAKVLYENNVNRAKIESNNGGRGFARNVERILWERFKSRKTKIEWFHQSENKMARILSNSTFVMEHIYFPWNWNERWPEYYKAMTSFQKQGKNKSDDAPDATTGLAEMIQGKTYGRLTPIKRSLLGI